MDEYIRREDVLKGKKTGTFANGICLVAEPCVTVKYIESIEPADVVQVVRCKDCRYFRKFLRECERSGALTMYPLHDTDFCSYGERKE